MMKATAVLLAICALLSVATCSQQLRHHELPFLDSMNPLQMASFMSGDYASVLPSFLQPIARKILGQEQSGTSSMLSKASSLLGGSGSSGSGMFGGLGNLLGGGNSGSSNGVMGSISKAFGGDSNSGSSSGLSSLISGMSGSGSNSGSSLGGLTKLIPGFSHE